MYRALSTLILLALLASTASLRAAGSGVVLSEIVLPGIDGKTYKLSDYRGKWVVVNYWATWCPPCLEEIPDLVDFHDAHHDKDAVVLGVNTEDLTAERLRAFSESYLISYPVLYGDKDYRQLIGPVPALPTTYIISPKGEAVARNIGPLTREQIEQFIAGQ
ncbi:MAG: TlpA disulfide reductase family protein [Granulosicoccaceae bacterium]|jgi:thiol-disulfide isomerase/thioredoxin